MVGCRRAGAWGVDRLGNDRKCSTGNRVRDTVIMLCWGHEVAVLVSTTWGGHMCPCSRGTVSVEKASPDQVVPSTLARGSL